MKCSHCPVNCTECSGQLTSHKQEYHVKARGNPDKELTLTREGYLCRDKSFFFCTMKTLKEEEELLNKFAMNA